MCSSYNLKCFDFKEYTVVDKQEKQIDKNGMKFDFSEL